MADANSDPRKDAKSGGPEEKDDKKKVEGKSGGVPQNHPSIGPSNEGSSGKKEAPKLLMQKLKKDEKKKEKEKDEKKDESTDDEDDYDDSETEDSEDDESEDESTKVSKTKFSDLGGIQRVLEELKREMMVHSTEPLLLPNKGNKQLIGILLQGPQGCGKTKLAHALANETKLPFHYFLTSKLEYVPQRFRKLFEELYKTTVSIVFIDDIDNMTVAYNSPMKAEFLTCMDECNSNSSSSSSPSCIFVIGATNKPTALGPEFRKPGRFDRDIFMDFPDESARVEILSILTRNLSLKSSVDLMKLSRFTPRFVAANLEKVVQKAYDIALKRIVNQRKMKMSRDLNTEEQSNEWWRQTPWQPKFQEIENPSLEMIDFEAATKMVQYEAKIAVGDGAKFTDFGGLSSVLEKLKMEIMLLRNCPYLLRNLGVKPVSGILLHGPPGCGKTKLTYAIANESAIPFHVISSAKLICEDVASGEKKIYNTFMESLRTAPSLLCIDGIDAIASRKDQRNKKIIKLAAQLWACMDEFTYKPCYPRTGYVTVIGTTNRPDILDPEVFKSGRFDCKIAIGFPDESARVEILSVLTQNLNLDSSVDLAKISRSIPRFVGADMEDLINKTGKIALKRIINQKNSEISRDHKYGKRSDEWKQPHWLPKPEEIENSRIIMADFEEAITMIKPSSEKSFDGLTFKDLGGIGSVLEELKMEIIACLNNPFLLHNLGIKPVSGILLHGPSGCGKTTLAHAFANESALPFHYISSTKILSDESISATERLQCCFEEAYRTAPSIVFIDEIDAIASKKTKYKCEGDRNIATQLLTYLDESKLKSSHLMHGFIVVIGATNNPDALDSKFRRSGRFDREITLDVPDEKARLEILSVHTRNKCLHDSVDLVELSKSTPKFVGADLAALVDKAGKNALKRKFELSNDSQIEQHSDQWWKQTQWLPEVEKTGNLCIHMDDFEVAVKTIRPSRENDFSASPDVSWNDVGGLDSLRQEFDRYIVQPVKYPEEYKEFGIDQDTGFLLHGPPGCGKTLVAKAVASEAGANFIHVKGPDLLSKYFGKSEQAIRDIFSKARKCSPCIIFFDEVDSLTTSRGEKNHSSDTILNQLLVELDGGDKRKGVFVIGATNRPEMMDAALLRPGRFCKSIRVPLPDADGRASILKALSRKKLIDDSVDFHAIARMKECENLTGAHLAALINEAAMAAMDEKLKSSKNCLNSTTSSIKTAHFEQVLPSISRLVLEKSILRERELSRIPDVKWEDVGGLDFLRKEFHRCITRRIKYPEIYEQFGIDLDNGFLLYGPPGCGKTLIAKAIANESGANFIHIKGPELMNKYIGESERAVREVFNQARICSPCILFFDEVDALTSKHGEPTNHAGDRVLNQLLMELDGGDKRNGVFVIGATNRRDVIDPAILRPGRFSISMYVPLPDADGRASILKALCRKKPVDASVDFHVIAQKKACENLSGADLAALVNEAAVAALEENLDSGSNSTSPSIKQSHFKLALKKVKSSVSDCTTMDFTFYT